MHEFINKILRQGITEYWYCTSQLQIVHTLYKNRAKSTGGNRARFSCSKKYKILIRSSTFYFKLSLMVSPSSFVLLTTSGSFPWTKPTWNSSRLRANEILSSLHFSGRIKVHSIFRRLKYNLICDTLSITNISLMNDLWGRVSSTNVHNNGEWKVRSFIIRINNHGPNLVPCGTPDGTGPHLEKQPAANLIRCERSDRKANSVVF